MLNIEEIKTEIVKRLLPLEPDKIILFGSYAYGNPTDESDIDLFIFKNIEKKDVRNYKLTARKKMAELVKKYKVGFDFIVASEKYVQEREDYFYKEEILKKGKIIYE